MISLSVSSYLKALGLPESARDCYFAALGMVAIENRYVYYLRYQDLRKFIAQVNELIDADTFRLHVDSGCCLKGIFAWTAASSPQAATVVAANICREQFAPVINTLSAHSTKPTSLAFIRDRNGSQRWHEITLPEPDPKRSNEQSKINQDEWWIAKPRSDAKNYIDIGKIIDAASFSEKSLTMLLRQIRSPLRLKQYSILEDGDALGAIAWAWLDNTRRELPVEQLGDLHRTHWREGPNLKVTHVFLNPRMPESRMRELLPMANSRY